MEHPSITDPFVYEKIKEHLYQHAPMAYYFIFMILSRCGLDLSVILSLKVSSFCEVEGQLAIYHAASDRYNLLPHEIERDFRDYLAERNREESAFISSSGGVIYASGFSHYINHLGKKCGIYDLNCRVLKSLYFRKNTASAVYQKNSHYVLEPPQQSGEMQQYKNLLFLINNTNRLNAFLCEEYLNSRIPDATYLKLREHYQNFNEEILKILGK